MITREEFHNQCLQLTQILNSPKLHGLVHPHYRFVMEEVIYHVSLLPDPRPYTTAIGLSLVGDLGAIHMMFQEHGNLIHLTEPHPNPDCDDLFTLDIRSIVRKAPKIIDHVTKVLIHGNITDGLWDGAWMPLNSRDLKYWVMPKDEQQHPWAVAEDEEDMMEL